MWQNKKNALYNKTLILGGLDRSNRDECVILLLPPTGGTWSVFVLTLLVAVVRLPPTRPSPAQEAL